MKGRDLYGLLDGGPFRFYVLSAITLPLTRRFSKVTSLIAVNEP